MGGLSGKIERGDWLKSATRKRLNCEWSSNGRSLRGGSGVGAIEVVNLHGLGFSLHNDGSAVFEAELLVVIGVVLQ